jgi:hypothetical protein
VEAVDGEDLSWVGRIILLFPTLGIDEEGALGTGGGEGGGLISREGEEEDEGIPGKWAMVMRSEQTERERAEEAGQMDN